jgi:hypothetical protein
LGHIAERSHLENPSTHGILVKEVGLDLDEGDDKLPILAAPASFALIWSDLGCNSEFGMALC